MKSPETAVANLSFTSLEFETLTKHVDRLKRVPQELPKKLLEAEAAIKYIQRHWHGMSEADIQEQARERSAKPEETIVHYNGTVVVVPGFMPVRAHLDSEHPILKAAKPVIKEGPAILKTLEGTEEYWRLEGYSEEVIEAMKSKPGFSVEPSYDRDVVEYQDLSQGSELSVRGVNVRTGKTALGAFGLSPDANNGRGFNIGFVMDAALQRQEVQVSIFERSEEGVASMNELLLRQLPHLWDAS